MERTEAELEAIGTRLRDAIEREGSGNDEIRRARATFLEEVARRNAGPTFVRSSWRRRYVPVALAALLGAGAAGVWLWPRPVSFQVGETRLGRLGDVIESPDGQAIPLRFSEGSHLLLHERGRMRVLSLASDKARVLVENGVLDVSIAHAEARKTRWDFEAGSYRVVVTGTRFRMAYDARLQSLGLSTQEGQVVVSGGCQQAPSTVSAGERVDLSCLAREASPLLGEGPAEQGADQNGPSEVRPRPDLLPQAAPSPARPARGEPVWRALLAAGRLAEGLRAAERAGFQRVYPAATAKELLVLADAARLFGSAAQAVIALRVLRQRFPGTMDAATAAFKLGRMAMEKEHAYGEAARWFEICLREQPSGPLMGDSFGRLMEARLRAGNLAGARSDAQQYLRRFPEGPYASEARGILSR